LLKAQALDSYIRVFRFNSELFDSWEVLFDDISLHNIIGEGAFGKVYRGELLKNLMEVGKGRKPSQRKTVKTKQPTKKGLIVAVKMLQSTICLCQCLYSKLKQQAIRSAFYVTSLFSKIKYYPFLCSFSFIRCKTLK